MKKEYQGYLYEKFPPLFRNVEEQGGEFFIKWSFFLKNFRRLRRRFDKVLDVSRGLEGCIGAAGEKF